MHELDRLKPISEMAMVDPRTRVTMSYFDEERGEQHVPTLAEHHASIASLQLIDKVLDDIRTNFETAKNLFLYAFYIYRFSVVACTQAYQTLEFALRERAKHAGITSSKLMLGALIRLAIQRGWLTDKAFDKIRGCSSASENSYSRKLVEILPALRNNLAHGSCTLFEPHRALEQLEICAAIINHLFADPQHST